MTKGKPWKPWGDHPVVVLIFLIAALIPIAVFVRGNLGDNPSSNNSTLVIRVANESGDSVSGAKAIILYSEGGLSQYTDVNGTVSISLPIPNPNIQRMIVEAEGFQIYEMQIQQLTTDVINVRLEERKGERSDVILRVVDSETESPISNAQITLVSNGDLYKEISDSDGFAQFTLDFPVEGKIDTQISVSAEKYKIENQIRTLLPGKLQYVLLSSNSLSIQIPIIPTSAQILPDIQASTPITNPENNQTVAIGSGVEISQKAGGSGVRVIVLKPDSQPWENVYVEAYEQIADVNGNPVRGNRIRNGRINQQGLLDFDLSDGTFAICTEEGAASGYGWTPRDCIYNIEVSSGNLTTIKLQPGQIEIAIAGASGDAWEGVYYEVYTQKQDVNGNPVINNRVANGRTNNTGIGYAFLTPGLYAVSVDLPGYNWGNLSTGKGQLNIAIEKGKSNRIFVNLGQLTIGLRNSAGQPADSVYIEVFTQTNDINGERILADRIWNGRTDIGGIAEVDLTKGLYALKIGENILYDILIADGKITKTDGVSFTQE